ncbi:hypothetical protein [Streptomyces sp. NRRL F-4474]|uniref:hypothetical protein n=1 Tax=Streptomyces sp. NRRL F-4474 TaxID=1463851 RepID=UPI00131AFE1A|nr:hypothetical protein [Streptomyces sp. NRRL F-4474]
MTTHELVAVCDACEAPIADGQGCIWIDYGKIMKQQEAVRTWEAETKAAAPPGTRTVVSYGDILSYPDAVRWCAHHAACDPDIDANAYSIEVHRLRTWADLTHWTAHLMGKPWLPATDWKKVLESAAHGVGTRITPVKRPIVHA